MISDAFRLPGLSAQDRKSLKRILESVTNKHNRDTAQLSSKDCEINSLQKHKEYEAASLLGEEMGNQHTLSGARKMKLSSDERQGRHYVATGTIRNNEVLLEEMPIAAFPCRTCSQKVSRLAFYILERTASFPANWQYSNFYQARRLLSSL